MSRGRSFFRGARLRRVVQIAALRVFFGLVLAARPQAGPEPGHGLHVFFHLDPLIYLATWLSAHAALTAGMIGALAVLALTAVLGRVFCGWFCPLGTLHDAAGWFFDRWLPNRRRREAWSPRQRIKYYLLVGFLAMAALGGHWVCIFDPLVLLYRTTATALLPAAQWAVEEGSTAIYRADPHLGPMHATAVTEPSYVFLRDNIFVVSKQAFLGGAVIFALFFGLLALNAYRRRFWCR